MTNLYNLLKQTHELFSDVDTSNDMLFIDSSKRIDIKISKERKPFHFLMDTKNNKIITENDEYIDKFIKNLIDAKKFEKITENNSYDFIEFILTMNDLYSYCSICGENVTYIGKNIACKKCEFCEKNMKSVNSDIVTCTYKKDIPSFNLIVLTAYSCLQHPNRNEFFNPMPEYYKNCDELVKSIKYTYGTFNKLLEIIESVKNDRQLCDKIDVNDYAFLKYIILKNTVDLYSDTSFNEKNPFEEKNIKNILEGNDMIWYQARYPDEKINKFNGSYYLFHGSSLSNWYSIMRNGLKNYSGTVKMINGQAHGSGIYLSDSFDFSYTYGIDRHSKSNLVVVGVVQLANPSCTYKKSENIYVVPDEKDQILRYIILVKPHYKKSFDITRHFIKCEQSDIKTHIISISTKRIANEINDLKEKYCNEKYGYELNTLENKDRTEIHISDKKIEFVILLSPEYPIICPFIYIKQVVGGIKNLKDVDNYIFLQNGGILFTHEKIKKWNPSITLKNMLKDLLKNLKYIDKKKKLVQYTYESSYNEYCDVKK